MVDLPAEHLKARAFEDMAEYLDKVALVIATQIQYLAEQRMHSDMTLAAKVYEKTRKLQARYSCIADRIKMGIRDIEELRNVRQTGK